MGWPQIAMAGWLGLVVICGALPLIFPSRVEWLVLTPDMQRSAAIGFVIGGIAETMTLICGGFWS